VDRAEHSLTSVVDDDPASGARWACWPGGKNPCNGGSAVRPPTAAAASDCMAAVCDDTPAFRSNFLGVFGPSFVRPSRSLRWYRSPVPCAYRPHKPAWAHPARRRPGPRKPSSARTSVGAEPRRGLVRLCLSRALLETGQAERALATAEAHLRRHPGHSGARALEAFCRIGVGDEAGALRLLDYPRFVATSTLVTPKGYSTRADFNAALSERALNHPSLLSAPHSNATAGGPALRLAAGRAARPDPTLESAVGRRPARTCASSASRAVEREQKWGCVALRSGGHQIPHIQPREPSNS